jgi:5-methylcytosine-specific restriction endonuclease McrA
LNECKCESRKQVFRIFANGTKHYGEQCQTCGTFFSKKKSEVSEASLVEFDESIKQQHRQSISDHFQKVRDNQSADIQNKMDARRKKYEAYIESDMWKKRRLVILERDKWICQGCLTRKADHVHHLTYDRLGNELAFDLISVCWICHDKAHGKEKVDLTGILQQAH